MRSIVAAVALMSIAVGLAACGGDGDEDDAVANDTTTTTSGTPAPIAVTSEAFDDGDPIPVKYSCHGENVSPPLRWSGAPTDAKSLAVVVDDPDAPGGTFVHWVVVNLPAATNSLAENVSGLEELANGRGDKDWTGPCPPSGPAHHYRFTVYALSGPIATGDTDEALETLDRTALARGTLTGIFER
jgi:Raf kinase inhibitor-like YbhB/YbcL family protein